MRTRTLHRRANLEEVTLEVRLPSTDRFGAASYDSPVMVDLIADQAAEFRHEPDGDGFTITKKFYIPGEPAVLPTKGSRITMATGRAFILTLVKPIRDTRGDTDHVYCEGIDDGAEG